MFSFLKNFKKVKKVSSAKLGKDAALIDKDFLFLAEKVQNAKEDGLDFSYKHLDCFFGNEDTYVKNGNSNVETFMMKKLTGEKQGELFMPDIEGMDFVLEVPNESGAVDKYVVDIYGLIEIGDGKKTGYKLEEIEAYVQKVNEMRKLKAKTAASKLAETKQKQ